MVESSRNIVDSQIVLTPSSTLEYNIDIDSLGKIIRNALGIYFYEWCALKHIKQNFQQISDIFIIILYLSYHIVSMFPSI